MLQAYETKYESLRLQSLGRKEFNPSSINAITSPDWEKRLKPVNLNDYKIFTVPNRSGHSIATYKPSDLLITGEYPFSNLEDNQLIISVVGNFHNWTSADDKIIV
jgi:hypothetical protein